MSRFKIYCVLALGFFSSNYLHADPCLDTLCVRKLLKKADSVSSFNAEAALHYSREALKKSQALSFDEGQSLAVAQLAELHKTLGKYDSAIFFYHRLIRMATTKKDSNAEMDALMGLGECFMRLIKADSALHYFKLSLEKGKGDTKVEAGVYNNIANVYLNESKLENALVYFIKSADLYEKMSDKKGLSKALSNIGNVEYRMNNFDKAIDYAQKSKKLAFESNHTSGVAYCHKLLGWIYRKQANVQKALLHYDSASSIYEKLSMKRDVAEINLSMGNAQYDQKNYKEAIGYYSKSMMMSRAISYKPFLTYGFSGLAYSYYSLKDYKKALTYTDSLAASAKSVNIRLLMDAYELKSLIHEKKGDLSAALSYHKQFKNLTDSLTQSENRNALEEMEARYQNNVKQSEIEKLKQEQELKDIRLSRLRANQTAIALALVLVIVIAALLVNRYRLINKAKRQIEVERMRMAIARDLHDDIGSALTTINIISQLGLKESPSQNASSFERISEQSSRILENMSDIVWSINPDNDSLEGVVMKIREFAAEILEPRNINFQLTATNLPSVILDSGKRKNILLITKEAINNAAKYSEAKTVVVTIAHKDKNLHLHIKDDGKGFEQNLVRQGNGLRNITERASMLGGKAEIISNVGHGVSIHIQIAIP